MDPSVPAVHREFRIVVYTLYALLLGGFMLCLSVSIIVQVLEEYQSSRWSPPAGLTGEIASNRDARACLRSLAGLHEELVRKIRSHSGSYRHSPDRALRRWSEWLPGWRSEAERLASACGFGMASAAAGPRSPDPSELDRIHRTMIDTATRYDALHARLHAAWSETIAPDRLQLRDLLLQAGPEETD